MRGEPTARCLKLFAAIARSRSKGMTIRDIVIHYGGHYPDDNSTKEEYNNNIWIKKARRDIQTLSMADIPLIEETKMPTWEKTERRRLVYKIDPEFIKCMLSNEDFLELFGELQDADKQ